MWKTEVNLAMKSLNLNSQHNYLQDDNQFPRYLDEFLSRCASKGELPVAMG